MILDFGFFYAKIFIILAYFFYFLMGRALFFFRSHHIINKWTDFLIFHWKKKNKTSKWKRMVLCYYIGFETSNGTLFGGENTSPNTFCKTFSQTCHSTSLHAWEYWWNGISRNWWMLGGSISMADPANSCSQLSIN